MDSCTKPKRRRQGNLVYYSDRLPDGTIHDPGWLYFSSAFYCGMEGATRTVLHLVGLLNLLYSTSALASVVRLVKGAAPSAPRDES
jgi:hypothetical protein